MAKLATFTGKRWPLVGKRLVDEFPYIEAEVKYAVKEYACTIINVLARRTRLAFLDVQAAEEAIPRIAEIMAKELNWNKSRRKVWQVHIQLHQREQSDHTYDSDASYQNIVVQTIFAYNNDTPYLTK